MSKSILITGGAGFIGSNFIPFFLKKYPQYQLVNLDKLTYAGSLAHLQDIAQHSNYHFVQGDIVDYGLLEALFSAYQFQGIIHFAAESHVDNSIKQPAACVQTNIQGTFSLLEIARKHWLSNSFEKKSEYRHSRFVHISTDEVYGSLSSGFFTENSPYAPNNPYSASKASSDFLVRSYVHTYGLDAIVTHCSNNFGPKQHEEKLIPTIIRKILFKKSIPLYGNGLHVRDWIYVLDHCKAIDMVFHYGKQGENYNIGSHNTYTNLALTKKICKIVDGLYPQNNGHSSAELIALTMDRPGHDQRYAIDASKITKELGWKPVASFCTSLQETIIWYLNYYKKKKMVSLNKIFNSTYCILFI